MNALDVSLYLAIYGIGMLLNTLQIAILLYQKRTKLPFDISLISLAVANLVLSIAPVSVHFYLLAKPVAALSRTYLTVIGYIYYASAMISAFQLGFIAFQRLIAVLYPHRFSTLITRRRCVITIFLLWLFSIILMVPFMLKFNTTYYKVYNHIPLLVGAVIFVSYAILICHLLKMKRVSTEGERSKRHRKIIFYSASVTAVFLLSTFPYTISILTAKGLHAIPTFASYMYIVHVIFDPLLYFLLQYLNIRRSSRQVGNIATEVQRVDNTQGTLRPMPEIQQETVQKL